MKRLAFLLALAGILLSINGCKKGDEDPFISLLSRKARLTGTWTATTGHWVDYDYYAKAFSIPAVPEIDTKGTVDSVVYDLKDSVLTVYYTDDEPDTYNYYYTMIFDKDGTCKFETYSNKIGTSTEKWSTQYGIWYFLDGNKELEVKDKERVVVQLTKEVSKRVYTIDNTTVTTIDSTMYDGSTAGSFQVIQLKELSNKEIKIVYDQQTEYDDGDYSKKYGEITFVQPE